MSWEQFKAALSVVDGPQNADIPHFSRTLATEYHKLAQAHVDIISGGGFITNLQGRDETLFSQLLAINMINRTIPSPINWLQTLAPAFISYWMGIIIVGPIGTVAVTSPGIFIAINLVPHTNYKLVVDALEISCKLHIMTVAGQFTTFTTPPIVSPWSGASLQCPG